MDLLLTDEQRLLQDSVAKMLAQAGGVKRTRSWRGKGGGFDRAMHVRMGAEGWFGLLVPVEKGGLGLGLTELGLVLMEAGRVLAPEPIGATAVVARSIAHGADTTANADLLAAVVEGRTIVMPAIEGDAGPVDASMVRVRAKVEPGGLRLDGKRSGVPMAQVCDGVLVAASLDNARHFLAYVQREAEGVSMDSRATVDGRPFVDLAFGDVHSKHAVAEGGEVHRSLYNQLCFAAAAELVGVMSAAHDMTVEYLKTRKQFGKPIGSFQALQHRAVDDFAKIVSARSFVFQVAARGGALSAQMASALKAHCGGVALDVTKSAIQMHGAIGFTDEYDVGLYLKRAMWLSVWLGNEARQRARVALMDQYDGYRRNT